MNDQSCDVSWCESRTKHTVHERVLFTYTPLAQSSAGALQPVVFAFDDDAPQLALVAVSRDLFARPDHLSVALNWPQTVELAQALRADSGTYVYRAALAHDGAPAHCFVEPSRFGGPTLLKLAEFASSNSLDTYMYPEMARHLCATVSAARANFTATLV